jgi:hypothetical protein
MGGQTSRLWAYILNGWGVNFPTTARTYFYVTGAGAVDAAADDEAPPAPDDIDALADSGYVGSVPIGGQTSGWKSVQWAVPTSAAGAYNYWARVYDHGTSQWLGSRISASDFTVAAAPVAARILSQWALPTPAAGGANRLWSKVNNTGGPALPAGARVYYSLAGAGSIDMSADAAADDVAPDVAGDAGFVGYTSVAGMASGAVAWKSFDYTHPKNAGGAYTLHSRVWDTGGGTWLGPWSTGRGMTVTAKPFADVVNLWPQSSTATQGTNKNLWGRVSSVGGVNLPADARLHLFVSGSGYVANSSVAGQAPGVNVWKWAVWNVPGAEPTGARTMWGRVFSPTLGWLGAWSSSTPITVN